MTYEKTLYFVTKEKKVNHIGFFNNLRDMHLLDSLEFLEEQGFTEDPLFVRESDDSVFIFSSFLPHSMIDIWLDQILTERAQIISEKDRKNMKGKSRKRREKEKKARESDIEKKIKIIGKVTKKHVREIHVPRKSSLAAGIERTAKIQTLRNRKKSAVLTKRRKPKKTQKSRKTLEMLKEEVRDQRKWEAFVPTCGECTFWETQILPFTMEETGACRVTGNFVSSEKRACSEFEKL